MRCVIVITCIPFLFSHSFLYFHPFPALLYSLSILSLLELLLFCRSWKSFAFFFLSRKFFCPPLASLTNIYTVGVRFNPGKGSGGTGKTNVGGPTASFGIWHELLPQVKEIVAKYDIKVVRIHTHIGSGSDPIVWQGVSATSIALVNEFPEGILGSNSCPSFPPLLILLLSLVLSFFFWPPFLFLFSLSLSFLDLSLIRLLY